MVGCNNLRETASPRSASDVDPTLYCLTLSPFELTVIKYPSGQVIANVAKVNEKEFNISGLPLSQIAISQSGRLFTYSDSQLKIYRRHGNELELEERHAISLPKGEIRLMSPSPTNDLVVFVVSRQGKSLDSVLVNLKRESVRTIATLEDSAAAIRWSADGRYIYPYRLNGGTKIIQIDARTLERRDLGSGTVMLASADGHQLLVNRGTGPLRVISAQTRKTMVEEESPWAWHSLVAFLADGQALAIESPLAKAPKLVLFNLNSPRKIKEFVVLPPGKGLMQLVLENEE